MARYTGPVCRLCRRSGEKLFIKGGRCYTPKCAVDKRSKPPGQAASQRRRLSDRGLQLRAKQKVRWNYGILERQFHRIFTQAARQAGVTGDTLLVLLERRLDSAVFRLGFADSRAQARQLVRHGHITVNGRKTDIPSYLVKEGDTIGWRPQSTRSSYYQQALAAIEGKIVPNWLSLNKETLAGQVLTLPTPEEIGGVKFDTKSVVEYYSR
ncbi:MAG: 30S ribosomal protein S4 [Chloroflexi bacterium]|nr:30S ribosomal protein S4 [Chloroflexota bacterium]